MRKVKENCVIRIFRIRVLRVPIQIPTLDDKMRSFEGPFHSLQYEGSLLASRTALAHQIFNILHIVSSRFEDCIQKIKSSRSQKYFYLPQMEVLVS
jgi:hypothetical protein